MQNHNICTSIYIHAAKLFYTIFYRPKYDLSFIQSKQPKQNNKQIKNKFKLNLLYNIYLIWPCPGGVCGGTGDADICTGDRSGELIVDADDDDNPAAPLLVDATMPPPLLPMYGEAGMVNGLLDDCNSLAAVVVALADNCAYGLDMWLGRLGRGGCCCMVCSCLTDSRALGWEPLVAEECCSCCCCGSFFDFCVVFLGSLVYCSKWDSRCDALLVGPRFFMSSAYCDMTAMCWL